MNIGPKSLRALKKQSDCEKERIVLSALGLRSVGYQNLITMIAVAPVVLGNLCAFLFVDADASFAARFLYAACVLLAVSVLVYMFEITVLNFCVKRWMKNNSS